MLTPEQHREFETDGFVRLRAAFSADAAAAMEERIWSWLGSRFGVSRSDPASWKVPPATGLQGVRSDHVFRAIGSEATLGAIDDLVGEGRWTKPSHWGQFLVTFPSEAGRPWTVPHRVWHTDSSFVASRDRVFGALVFSFLSDVPPGHGGTVVVAGSHRVVRHYLDAHPGASEAKISVTRRALLRSDPWLAALASDRDEGDRVERFMQQGSVIGDVAVRVVELTGTPGDVVVAHPWMLHATSPNCGSAPRFMRVQRIRPC